MDRMFLNNTADFILRSNLPRNLDKRTTITIGDQTTTVEASDLQKICDLGRGAYGIVEKMRHIPSGTIMAVKVSDNTSIGIMIEKNYFDLLYFVF